MLIPSSKVEKKNNMELCSYHMQELRETEREDHFKGRSNGGNKNTKGRDAQKPTNNANTTLGSSTMGNLNTNAPKSGHKYNRSENFCSNPLTGGSKVECKKRCSGSESKKNGAEAQANESLSDLSPSGDGKYTIRKNDR
jgi:hypothetical protein